MPVLKNKKHEQFAHDVAKGKKPRDAYIDAGFSAKGADQSASRLLKNADVAARIAELSAKLVERAIEKTGVDKAWVIDQLVDNVKIAKAAVPVVDSEGQPVGEYRTNIPAANQALTLIGKELGMFTDKVETVLKVEELPDEKVKSRIGDLLSKAKKKE